MTVKPSAKIGDKSRYRKGGAINGPPFDDRRIK